MQHTPTGQMTAHFDHLAAGSLSPADVAILQAALCDGSVAIDAFHQWRSLADFEKEHYQPHHRLIPLVHANMKRVGLDDDRIMKKMQIIHRRAWGEGQKKLRVAADVLALMDRIGVQTMVTKGMALLDGYYDDIGLRPMEDIDLVIDPTDVKKTLEALEANGWRHSEKRMTHSARSLDAYIIRTNTIELKKDGACSIDLHWQPYHECDTAAKRDVFWRDVETTRIGGASVLRPNPGNMLFHTIAHGVRPNVLSSMRWIADAVTVLKGRGADIDARSVIDFAERNKLQWRFTEGLVTLAMFYDLDPPFTSYKPKMTMTERFEQKAFDEIEDEEAFDEDIDRRLISRCLRFVQSDKVRHIPLLLADIVDRRFFNKDT